VFLITIRGAVALLSVFFLLAANTLGFDGYFHAISVSSFENISYFNSPWFIYDYPVPRYLLFHYFFFLISFLGVFPFYPILGILLTIILINLINVLRDKNSLLLYSIILFFVVNTIFFSALSFSFLLLLSGFLSKGLKGKAYLFLGCLMHPVGFLIGGCYLLVTRNWLILISSLTTIFFLIFLTPINEINQDRRFSLDVLYQIFQPDRYIIADKFIGKLKYEGLFLLIIIALLYVTSKRKLNFLCLPRFKFYFLLLISFSVSCYSLSAQFRTGGPYSAFSMYYFEPSDLAEGKLNILIGSWVSPIFFKSNVIYDQYHYRDEVMQ
jgi:hypothetical protein